MRIPKEDDKIVVFGQETEIIRVEKDGSRYRCYIESPVVVPTVEYTRNFVYSDEIQKYLLDEN